jgi:putative ABC transport system permease protein
VIGIDDATLGGAPAIEDDILPDVIRAPDAVIIDAGGTIGKLDTVERRDDQWPRGGPHLNAPMRPLAVCDEVLVNDRRVVVKGRSNALRRYPPRPLLYTSYSNAARILLRERHRLTFVLAMAASGVTPSELVFRIQNRTGLKARTADDFKALGATTRLLLAMVFVQAAFCAVLGTGLGLGLCAILGQLVAKVADYPFRMMWFTPLIGGGMVLLVSVIAGLISARPVLKLEPAVVFAGR